MDKLDNFIGAMYQAHLDNAAMVYSGQLRGRPQTIMPATPFIFDYFIYNSLYSVDWQASEEADELVYFDRSSSLKESDQQKEFEKFISRKTDKSFNTFYKAFEPFAFIDLAGNWTQTIATVKITKQDGEEFWKRALKLQFFLNNQTNKISNKTTDLIREMSRFVYLVRNNIFHGSKQVGISSDMDTEHKKRLQIYDLFIRCVISWFFLAMGRREASSSMTQIGVDGLIEQGLLIKANNYRVIKPKDCFLLPKVRSSLSKMLGSSEENPKGALLYPACGTDWLTPLLLGLPYCDEFIFVDKSTCAFSELKKGRLLQPSGLVSLVGGSLERDLDTRKIKEPLRLVSDTVSEFNFVYKGRTKKITFIQDDVNTILTLGSQIRIFFHRDDFGGECTSDIGWLSTEVNVLKESVNFAPDAVFITNMKIDETSLNCTDSFSGYSNTGIYKLGFLARGL